MAKQSFSTGQVLTAQQVNDLQTNDFNQTVSAKTASYTLVAADKGTRITMSSTSATSITINTGLFAAGDTLFIQNLNTGVCTITAGTATVDTSASLALAQHEGGTLYFTSAGVSTFFKAAGATASSGGMTLISETVLSSNSGLNLTGISGSYKQLLLVWSGVNGALNNRFVLRLNNDSTAGIYALAQWGYAGTTVVNSQGTSTNIDSNGIPPFGYNVDPADSGEQFKAQGEFLIDNYASATKYKTFFGKWSFFDGNDNVNKACNVIGVYKTTSAVTSIDVVRTEGSSTMSNLSNTSVRLYGIS